MATNDYHELINALRFLFNNVLQQKQVVVRGLLGDGNGNVDVPDQEGFSFYRPDRSGTKVFRAFNKTVQAPDGTPVLIGELPWQPDILQIISVDWQAYLKIGWDQRFSGNPLHGSSHEWNDGGQIGGDPFTVYLRQMFPLRTEAVGSGSTSVLVTPYNWFDGSAWFQWPGTPGIDLSPAIPSTTGTVRDVLVYWEPDSGISGYGTLGIATGTLVSSGGASIPPRPITPANTIPSAFVRLYGGQGSIDDTSIYDARQPWTIGGGGSGFVTGSFKPSQLWEADGDNVVVDVDNSGNYVFNPTQIDRDFTVNVLAGVGLVIDGATGDVFVGGTKFGRQSDPDTYFSFTTADAIKILAGGVELLTLTGAAQDLVQINPNGGNVDTEIGYNGGVAAKVEGSSGDTTLSGNVILDGTTKALKGSSSNVPDLGTTTSADKIGNAYLASGKDIYPDDDTAGLWKRSVNIFNTPTTHFKSFSSWTWAAYTGFVTPGTIDTSTVPSFAEIGHTAGQGATRSFAYRSSYSAEIWCRCLHGALATRTGLRMDDGTNTNYAELFLEPSGGLTKLRYRISGGAITDLWAGAAFPSQLFVLRMFRSGDTVLLFYAVNSPIVTFLTTQTVVASWAPTRSGIYHEHTDAANFGGGRYSVFDWYYQT